MRITRACTVCRQKKIKCVFEKQGPCNYCKIIENEPNCVLYTTREYMKIKRLQQKGNSGKSILKFDLNKELVEASTKIAVQHFPELFFLNFGPSFEIVNNLDYLVKLAIYALAVPFNDDIENIQTKEILAALESQFFLKLEDQNINFVTVLQTSILMLLLHWQKGNIYKGYLVGGMADRACKVLISQNFEFGSLLDRELYLRTIWSYQLITLSLRDEPIKVVKSRLYKIRFPLSNLLLHLGQDSEAVYMKSFDVRNSADLISLLIKSADIWIDCLDWVFKGGKNYFKEAPWDSNSEWSRIERKICLFQDNLGKNACFGVDNLNSYFGSNEASLYCSVHLTLMVSRILLHRDFIPLIPTDTEGPKGPFDKLPWLDNPPVGWWQDSATTVFQTAKNASIIFSTFKKTGKYSCSSFNGFVALTVASVLCYINHFPYYDLSFKNASTYYNYCFDYLSYYGKYLGLGSYYRKVLLQNDKIFEVAVKRKISPEIMNAFEQMKSELLDIANVSGPINNNAGGAQIDNLISSYKTKIINKESETINDPETLIQEQNKQEAVSGLTWDPEWISLDNCLDFWPPYMGNEYIN